MEVTVGVYDRDLFFLILKNIIMTFLQSLQSLFGKAHTTHVNTTFECPNCWGVQQWDDEEKAPLSELVRDSSLIGRSRKSFIQHFTDRYVPGSQKPRRT